MGETDTSVAVWRGSTWLVQSRCVCLIVLLAIALPGALATGALLHDAPATVGFLAAIALLWEWRARKMGLAITDEGIVAIRAVNRVHLKWIEIASFFTRPAGIGLWGDKTIRIQRKQLKGRKVPVGVGMRLPTLMFFGQTNAISRLFGPCDLICGRQRIPQERVVDFLTEQLASRRETSAVPGVVERGAPPPPLAVRGNSERPPRSLLKGEPFETAPQTTGSDHGRKHQRWRARTPASREESVARETASQALARDDEQQRH